MTTSTINPTTGNIDLLGGSSLAVLGPASSTDNAIVRFDGTTGKLIQNSSVLINDSGQIQFGAFTFSFPSASGTFALTSDATLAGVSALSTDAAKSLYTMTSTIPVEFKTSSGNRLFYLDETNRQVEMSNQVLTYGTTASDAASTTSLDISTGWTSTGWTGSYGAFTHTTGNTNALSNSNAAVIGTVYRVTVRSEGGSGFNACSMSFGGVASVNGFLSGINNTVTYYPTATSTAGLVLTPSSSYNGTITTATVEIITPSQGLYEFYDSTNTLSSQFRFGTSANSNNFIGLNSGRYSLTGTNNVALGNNSMAANISGSGNIAIGRSALSAAVSPSTTVVIGDTAGAAITTGTNNTIVGGGSGPVLASGSNNTIVGGGSGLLVVSGSANTVLGSRSGLKFTGNSNTVVGDFSFQNPTGNSNTVIGNSCLNGNATSSASSNVAIGVSTGNAVTTAGSCVFIGNSNGATTTSSTFSISIGTGINHQSATANGQLTIANLIIGAGLNTSNLGATLSSGRIGIAVAAPLSRFHLPAGSATANTAPLQFTSGTVETAPRAGVMEFTTDDLFFTITTGDARKRLLMADPAGGLTSGRIPQVTTNGRLTDTAGITVAADVITATGFTGALNGTLGATTPASAIVTSLQADSITNDTGLAAGTYTPTRSAETNLDANVTMFEAQYMRVGNTVTVSGRFTADPTLTATPTSFEMTLPVASNIGAVEDVAGVAFSGSIAGMGAEISGSVANDTMVISWVSTDITAQSWSFTATYSVI